MDDNKISDSQEKSVIDYLSQEISDYDLVLVGDFGHGFITNNLISLLTGSAKKLAVNVQTNGANMGYDRYIQNS